MNTIRRMLGYSACAAVMSSVILAGCSEDNTSTTPENEELGTIVIDQTPDVLAGAGWSLSGPQSETGTGDITLTEMPLGSYTLTWDVVVNYATPASDTRSLVSGGAIMFRGTYEEVSTSIIGSVETPGEASGVAVSGSYAYVTDYVTWGNGGLQVVDISTPSSPAIIGSVEYNGAWDVAVSGNYAYVAVRENGLRVVDISTPSSPSSIGGTSTTDYAYGVAVSGSYAYVADGLSGLQVVDISTPSSPVIVGTVDTPSQYGATGVAVSGIYAYVADGVSGLQVVDISTPSSPVIIGSVDTPDAVMDVAVSGIYAYVADYTAGGLRVVDISTPSSPVIIGSVDTPGMATCVAVSGSYAFVNGAPGIHIVDISTPSSPVIVGTVDTPSQHGATDVAVSGNYAYVADGESGLQIVDISQFLKDP